MNSLLRQLFVLASAILAGCASTHNLKTEGNNLFGGGFIDRELRPGLYRMTARSNNAVWPSFAAARSTWQARAEELCGKDSYTTFDTATSEGRAHPVPFVLRPGVVLPAYTYNATISGYLLCKSSSLTVDQARDFLRAEQIRAEQQAAKVLSKELELLGGGECGVMQAGVSSETYFRRAQVLMALQKYGDARSCFVRAQDGGSDSSHYRQACESLGLLYEVGLSVEKNPETARAWYRKAGL